MALWMNLSQIAAVRAVVTTGLGSAEINVKDGEAWSKIGDICQVGKTPGEIGINNDGTIIEKNKKGDELQEILEDLSLDP